MVKKKTVKKTTAKVTTPVDPAKPVSQVTRARGGALPAAATGEAIGQNTHSKAEPTKSSPSTPTKPKPKIVQPPKPSAAKLALNTGQENTWCPGCPNFMILESLKRTLASFIDDGTHKHQDFCVTTDIGCHGKTFDYLNVSGIYALHGRAIPTALGIKIGNPNLKLFTVAGDGAVYSEGISHLIHAFKYNPDMTLIVHDNQSFSLTTGQPTPTSQQGWLTKSEPLGVVDRPLNPLKLALACNATFIARANGRNMIQMQKVFRKAFEHKGFSFVEVMQDCIVYNLEINKKDARMYGVDNGDDLAKAHQLAEEWDYNTKEGKIPIGILYQKTDEPTFEDKWPQLRGLMEKGVGWVDK